MFSTLPRNGNIAWKFRSRPCLALPPAESPSTMNNSDLPRPDERQSLSLPGNMARDVLVLRETDSDAARDAALARADAMMRATIDSATVRLLLSHCSRAARIALSTVVWTSGLFKRSFVWPWNCGSEIKTDRIATKPSRISSCPTLTPLGIKLCVSKKLRTALPSPARRPFSCVPPFAFGIPLQ